MNYKSVKPTMYRLPAFISMFFCLIIVSTGVYAQPFTAKCVGVTDGDTITVLTSDKKQIKIRLYGIDCPEGGQAFGKKAKRFTSQLVFGKTVKIKPVTKDRYGRTVAHVFVDGKSLSHEIVAAGYGWHYVKYSSDYRLTHLENKARQARLGLWEDAQPVAPWDWRKQQRERKQYKPNQSAMGAGIAYHGNVKSRKFHHPRCRHYNCKNCVVDFSSREEAISSGFEPCGTCRP